MKTFRTLDLAIKFYEKFEAQKISGHLRDLKCKKAVDEDITDVAANQSLHFLTMKM